MTTYQTHPENKNPDEQRLSSERSEGVGLRIVHVIDHFYPRLGYQETFLAREQGRRNSVSVITSDVNADEVYSANSGILGKKFLNPGLSSEEGIKTYRLHATLDSKRLNHPWLAGLEKLLI